MPPTRTPLARKRAKQPMTNFIPSVYDAAAGRVARYRKWRLHPNESLVIPAHLELPAMAPDEVLFRAKDAPVRFLEDDIYAADRHLPADLPLPDSDLLKAIHTYTADFYARQFPKNSYFMDKSMDETALLAFGYLLEEAVCQDLGETGDLALVEGRLCDEDPHSTRQAQVGFTHEDLPSVKDPPSRSYLAGDYKLRDLGALRLTHSK